MGFLIKVLPGVLQYLQKSLGFISSPFKWLGLVLVPILGNSSLKRIVVISLGIVLTLGCVYGVYKYRNLSQEVQTAQESILELKSTLGKVSVSLKEEKARNRILVDSMRDSVEQTLTQSKVRNEKINKVREVVRSTSISTSDPGDAGGSVNLNRLYLIREAGNKYIRGDD